MVDLILVCKLVDSSLIIAFSFTLKFTYTITLFSLSSSTFVTTFSALSKPFTILFTKFSKVSFVISSFPSAFSNRIPFL